MAFMKGVSGNPAGKPKGAKNKVAEALRETISSFLSSNFEQVKADFQELSPKDRAKLYCDLLQYGLPKLQSMTVLTEFDRLTDEQLDKLIEELKK